MNINLLPACCFLTFSGSAMSDENPFDFDDSVTPEGSPVSTASIFHIGKEEVPGVEELARGGDVKSMLRLYRFYDMSESDSEKAFKWLLMAANAGDLESQHEVAVSYMNLQDFENAKTWALKAIDGGHEHAKSLLQTIKSKQK